MSYVVNIAVHSSQSPENVRLDLIESLRARRVNHKFHYDSIKQTHKWLALHQAHSPSRNDHDCTATYDRAFDAVAGSFTNRTVHLVGLGCGGGQKDTRLIDRLKSRQASPIYTPSDVSAAMTLVARQTALRVLPPELIFPLVCDLATADGLPGYLSTRHAPRGTRLITFFGMIPNFEPADILPKLAALLRRSDTLLFSANLAPGKDYSAGMEKILPQYDNDLTREWLLTFLLDLGVERSDGELEFGVEKTANGLHRVVARFEFRRASEIFVEGESFRFKRADSLRLFYSYRYTPERLRRQLTRHGLNVHEEWITRSGEEGVFLCRRG